MNIAIYARVSTTDQDNENQLIQLREYCDRQQWTITAEYLDEVSGGSDQRPQFKRLFKDAHQRRFDTVLFWALDRFSREGSHKTLNHLNEQRVMVLGLNRLPSITLILLVCLKKQSSR